MTISERSEDWTGPQLAAHLAALEGVAPEPVEYLVCRLTVHADGREGQTYLVADEPAPLNGEALPRWLSRHKLLGGARLALAMLVIHEQLDEAGLIRECALERRRGAIDGPLYGQPARVEFAGPARLVRLYRVHRDGRLTEIAASPETLPPRQQRPEQFGGEQHAVRIHFGPHARMIDAREPTLFEAMAGLDSVLHVRLPDGQEIGCGVGWHGPVPFVLPGTFPRFGAPLTLPPEQEAAVQAALQRDGLVRHETRCDETGLAVVARRRHTQHLFLLRPEGGAVSLTPYDPSAEPAASPDQARWMRYAATYENLTMLDAWRDGDSDDLLVVSGDTAGQVWRHQIDCDGVETWRRPDADSAAGLLHRERLLPGTIAAADAVESNGEQGAGSYLADEADPVPAESLLAKAEAYVLARDSLRNAREAADAGAPPADAFGPLRVLQSALLTLEAGYAGAEARLVLRQLEEGRISAERLAAALDRIASHLPDELAAIRVVTLTPPQWHYLVDPTPFGAAVEAAFPDVAYDIEEAAACLAFRRPSAVAFHAMRIIQCGLAALAGSWPAELPSGEDRWVRMIAVLRSGTGPEHARVLAALEQVRRCWRGPRLLPAGKYTETEAERLFRAAGSFMSQLAEWLSRQAG